MSTTRYGISPHVTQTLEGFQNVQVLEGLPLSDQVWEDTLYFRNTVWIGM